MLISGLFVLLGLSEHAPTVLLLLGVIGFVDGTTDVVFEIVVQREVDGHYLGSVFGIASAVITSTMMAAVAIAPAVNGVLDARVVVLAAGLLLATVGLVSLALSRAAAARPTFRPQTGDERERSVGSR